MEYYKKVDKSLFRYGITIPNKHLNEFTFGEIPKAGTSATQPPGMFPEPERTPVEARSSRAGAKCARKELIAAASSIFKSQGRHSIHRFKARGRYRNNARLCRVIHEPRQRSPVLRRRDLLVGGQSRLRQLFEAAPANDTRNIHCGRHAAA